MTKRKDLTEGSIVKGLISLSLPIMGTSFLQMAYNMTDMIWLGRVGGKAVAAAGTATRSRNAADPCQADRGKPGGSRARHQGLVPADGPAAFRVRGQGFRFPAAGTGAGQ